MIINRFIVILFFIFHLQFLWAQKFELFLFVYESDQTESGAGHVAIAFGEDTNHLIYYTKYRQRDGGGRKVERCSLHEALTYDCTIIKTQSKTPSLVIYIPVENIALGELEKVSDFWHLKEPWTLFVNNCTDAVKRVLRKSKINPGFAFMVSTPNELIEDMVENNQDKFKNQTYRCISGDLCFYLKNERNGVPQTLFGKRKKRNFILNKPCF